LNPDLFKPLSYDELEKAIKKALRAAPATPTPTLPKPSKPETTTVELRDSTFPLVDVVVGLIGGRTLLALCIIGAVVGLVHESRQGNPGNSAISNIETPAAPVPGLNPRHPEGRAVDLSGPVRIDYRYDGPFGKYGFPDTALAHVGNTLVARADAEEVIKVPDAGPNHLRVREKHLSADGRVAYEGIIVYKFGVLRNEKVSETAVNGVKDHEFFDTWPANN
jgi:hypothetical protein